MDLPVVGDKKGFSYPAMDARGLIECFMRVAAHALWESVVE